MLSGYDINSPPRTNLNQMNKFKIAMAMMEKKVGDFDRVRDIMKIAPIDGGNGLNDDGEECDMTMPFVKAGSAGFTGCSRDAAAFFTRPPG